MKMYEIPKTALKMQKIAGERAVYSGVRFNNHTATVTDAHRAIIHMVDPNHENLPDNETWRFSGLKPTGAEFRFSVNGDNLAIDISGNARGNATILDDDKVGSYPPVAKCLPDDLSKKIIIRVNAKYLFEMAKVLADENHMVNLIIDPATPVDANSHKILVTGQNPGTVGLLMGCRASESDKADTQQVIADYKTRVKD